MSVFTSKLGVGVYATFLRNISWSSPTPAITGPKKQSDEGATLFAVRVYGIARAIAVGDKKHCYYSP